MSLLFSDSLTGLLDEAALDDDSPAIIGIIEIGAEKYEVDSFLTDGTIIRVHALGEPDAAISMARIFKGLKASITLGDNDFAASGSIKQVGWERLPHGNRIIISMSVRDK